MKSLSEALSGTRQILNDYVANNPNGSWVQKAKELSESLRRPVKDHDELIAIINNFKKDLVVGVKYIFGMEGNSSLKEALENYVSQIPTTKQYQEDEAKFLAQLQKNREEREQRQKLQEERLERARLDQERLDRERISQEQLLDKFNELMDDYEKETPTLEQPTSALTSSGQLEDSQGTTESMTDSGDVAKQIEQLSLESKPQEPIKEPTFEKKDNPAKAIKDSDPLEPTLEERRHSRHRKEGGSKHRTKHHNSEHHHEGEHGHHHHHAKSHGHHGHSKQHQRAPRSVSPEDENTGVGLGAILHMFKDAILGTESEPSPPPPKRKKKKPGLSLTPAIDSDLD